MNGRSLKSTEVTSSVTILGAEALRLLAEALHQLGAQDALGEAGVVLDVGRDHQLTAGLETLDTERVQIRARGVHGGRQACAGAADDDQLTDIVTHGPERRTSLLRVSPSASGDGNGPIRRRSGVRRKSFGIRYQPASA